MNNEIPNPLELTTAYGGNFLIPFGDTCIGKALKQTGAFETEDISRVTTYLDSKRKSLSKRSIFIDIGANIGTHSISALKEHGYKQVLAIEPSEENYRLLTANICLNGLIEQATCINAAASNHDGEETLYRNPSNCGDHRLGNDPHGDSKRNGQAIATEQVRTINIAQHLLNYTGEIQLQDSLCWIDTQGHEIPILSALKPLLDRGLAAVIEFWPYGMTRQKGSFDELEKVLKSPNLKIAHLENDKIDTISLRQLKLLWESLLSSDTEEPDGASFSNIIIFKDSHQEEIDPCEANRILMTLRCQDSNLIPKVEQAGEIVTHQGESYQIMHNGLKVVSGGYYGSWMREIIKKLRGHHEPQEEKVFHEIVQRASRSGLMIELGCYWAYYSLWFLKDNPDRKAIGLEPDPVHLNVARQNAYINKLEHQFTMIHGISSATSSTSINLTTESGQNLKVDGYTVEDLLRRANVGQIEILHCDAQGAETYIVDQVVKLGKSNQLRFCIISTHSYEITADPLTHQKCLEKLRSSGAHIIAEHDVHESYSGDGLIAASFSDIDKDLAIEISCNRYSHSLFPNPAVHFANALSIIEDLRKNEMPQNKEYSCMKKQKTLQAILIRKLKRFWEAT
jgi:FkbM family methyltransferase